MKIALTPPLEGRRGLVSILWWGVVGFPFELSADTVQALLSALGPLAFFFVPTGRIEALLDHESPVPSADTQLDASGNPVAA